VKRIVLVDDHPVVRDGIRAAIEDAGSLHVIAQGATAADALAIVAREKPDVIVLDLELPDRSGLDIIALIAATGTTSVVVFTAYAGDDRVRRAFEAGTSSYVLKGSRSEDLLAAIAAAAEGKTWISPGIATDMANALRRDRPRLTEREREILQLVAQGLSNKRIAQRLSITERTVKFHVAAIFGRLGARNRAQAISLAQERGLLPL
jgi:DNA-binding NarL/FixJ family response regulator